MSRDLGVLFRKRLAGLREAEGLTQAKLSEMIGAGPQYVGHVETGRIKTPPWERTKKLAKALNVSLSDLFSLRASMTVLKSCVLRSSGSPKRTTSSSCAGITARCSSHAKSNLPGPTLGTQPWCFSL
jgi:DNA-binding XRE family transcriptional regulator